MVGNSKPCAWAVTDLVFDPGRGQIRDPPLNPMAAYSVNPTALKLGFRSLGARRRTRTSCYSYQ